MNDQEKIKGPICKLDTCTAATDGKCLEGFSTFACKPLVNLHDLAVIPAYRGQGVGARLLESVEAIARARGSCKLTLEVLSGNGTALGVYARSGFAQYQLDPAAGQALFLQKWLDG